MGVGNGLKITSGSDLFLTRKGAKVKEARREFGEKSGNFPRPVIAPGKSTPRNPLTTGFSWIIMVLSGLDGDVLKEK